MSEVPALFGSAHAGKKGGAGSEMANLCDAACRKVTRRLSPNLDSDR